MRRKLLLVFETEALGDVEAQDVLDAFRESVLPSAEHDILLTRATEEDLLHHRRKAVEDPGGCPENY